MFKVPPLARSSDLYVTNAKQLIEPLYDNRATKYSD